MTQALIFDPLVPWALIWGLAAAGAAFLALALWRGLGGWTLRGLALAVLLTALANPSIQTEDRAPLKDIVILLVDDSASQSLSDRPAQTAAAIASVTAQVAAMPDTELRVVRFGDGQGDQGTRALAALGDALANEPRARVAGAILVTDGQVHDLPLAPALQEQLPAPLNVLLTGQPADWDRRLIIKDAPAFAILQEPQTLIVRIEDQGQSPAGTTADLTISVDGGETMTYQVPVGQDMELPVTLAHGGMNVLQFSTPADAGELTDRNNAAVVQINGVRDRLRVLLVSGEPHAGERVWRNLLKSDPSVDLVHFTILRPPEKQDGVPVEELSLIAFPTRELFVEKINEFDLIIFDRYRLRGILPMSYLQNIADYVRGGGTVLVAAGPEFGAVDSLWRSPLAEVLPVDPTSQVVTGGFRAKVTDLGQRHPVTEGLEKLAPKGGWGRWFRLIDVIPHAGQVLMSGPDDRPLLVVNRVDQGRVAVLASDQAWLWGRGYEGGGPQLELLRRLAHWMLKEPELEEEALVATAIGQDLTITRRTVLDTPPGPVTLTKPDGSTETIDLEQKTPGRFTARYGAPELGLYRLAQGEFSAVVAVGPRAPKEFEATIADPEPLAPVVAPQRGGILRLFDGMPDLRAVSAGRQAYGRGWIGITPRGAYVTQGVSVSPALPVWVWLLAALITALAAWVYEGRRSAGRVA